MSDRAVEAARAVVKKLEDELASWRSYSGPVMQSQIDLEKRIEGARAVLAAVEAAGRRADMPGDWSDLDESYAGPGATMITPVNPVPITGYQDENDRIARETARDAWRATYALLRSSGKTGKAHFGVQHVGGKIILMIEVRE